MEHTFMMTLDHVGNQVHAQLGQQPLAHTTESVPCHFSRDKGRSPV